METPYPTYEYEEAENEYLEERAEATCEICGFFLEDCSCVEEPPHPFESSDPFFDPEDLNNPDYRCKHGNFIGNPYGGDYLCGQCEME